jgi:hypothetical protein
VNARARGDFSRFDPSEANRELAKALGGDPQLDSRLKQIQISKVSAGSTSRVIALVNEQGKVLEAQSNDAQTTDSLISEAKSLTLTPISWPEHSIRSIRMIEFANEGAKFSLIRSYVGEAPAP